MTFSLNILNYLNEKNRMKKINLPFVSYSIVKLSWDPSKVPLSFESIELPQSGQQEFKKIDNFEYLLNHVQTKFPTIQVTSILRYDFISNKEAFVLSSLPRLILNQTSLEGIPFYIFQSIRMNMIDLGVLGLEDVDTDLLVLLPTENDNCESMIMYNHYIYTEIMQASAFGDENLDQWLLRAPYY